MREGKDGVIPGQPIQTGHTTGPGYSASPPRGSLLKVHSGHTGPPAPSARALPSLPDASGASPMSSPAVKQTPLSIIPSTDADGHASRPLPRKGAQSSSLGRQSLVNRNSFIHESHDGRSSIEEEDWQMDSLPSARDKLNAFLEGKFSQLLMTFITVFALFGDDLRLVLFFRAQDDYFFAFYCFSLFMFATELTLQAAVIEEYKWSFFFWLDVIATASLIPDIPWIMDGITGLFAGGTSEESGGSEDEAAQVGRTSRAGTRAGRIVRLVRLVRLIRVVNLTKFCSKEKTSELDQEAETGKKDAPKGERVQASRLGKILSEQTTRRVIVGVLSMMIVWPQLEPFVENEAPAYGLEQLFFFGRSSCSPIDEFLKDPSGIHTCNTTAAREHPWMTEEGWNFLVFQFSQQSRAVFRTESVPSPLLYLRTANFHKGGTIEDIGFTKTTRCRDVTQPQQYKVPINGLPDTDCPENYCCWEPHPPCTGAGSGPDCPWRESELKDISFTPQSCYEEGASCSNLRITAKFVIREFTQQEASNSMARTCFIVFLLGFGSVSFSSDTQSLVIAPIEKMVNIVKQLADDPLAKPKIIEEEVDDSNDPQPKKKGDSGQLETSMLETTILKIGGLLQVGFGEAGAMIIGQNMASQDGEIDFMMAGRKVVAIYGFCTICDFMDTTGCLLEEVMVFVNKIAHIVHTCVNEWKGAANKNIGDSFLVTWMVADPQEQQRMLEGSMANSDKMQELADRALVAFIKVISEIRRASDLAAYAKHPKIIPKFGVTYKVRLDFGLHCGWSIEGAIGSKHKIDASYLSPHVNIAARVMSIARMYGVDLLFTDAIAELLSSKAREKTRKIDVVIVKGSNAAIGIHTFDVNEHFVPAPEGHSIGQIVPMQEMSVAELQSKTVEHLFMHDQDIVQLNEGYSIEMMATWANAFKYYQLGSWDNAQTMFQRCSNLVGGDGPSDNLIAFIQENDSTPPPNWKGCRKLLFK